MRQKHFIDTHKGITPLFVFFLISYYSEWDNILAVVYLALHGSYGILWISKSLIFPDKQWNSKCKLWYGILIWIGLSLYWIAPVIIITPYKFQNFIFLSNPSNLYLFLCISIYTLGVFLHFGSDMQKHSHLKLNPNKLIKDGFFLKIRNPNYLGELLIYVGFIALSCNWIPFGVLMIFVFFVWLPNMKKKDVSLSRYADFNDYKNKTYKFIPFIY